MTTTKQRHAEETPSPEHLATAAAYLTSMETLLDDLWNRDWPDGKGGYRHSYDEQLGTAMQTADEAIAEALRRIQELQEGNTR